MKSFILSVLVSNHFGVLTRVTNLFSRRGYNIKSLAVGETENPNLSRITILTEGDARKGDQIKKQLNKLEDVKTSMDIPDELLVSRELLLMKLNYSAENEEALDAFLQEFGAKKLAKQSKSIIVELTETTQKVDEFIEKAKPYGVMEVCRTGQVALANSNQTIDA